MIRAATSEQETAVDTVVSTELQQVSLAPPPLNLSAAHIN